MRGDGGGYIKLHRRLMQHWVARKSDTFAAWVDLLLMAAWKEHRVSQRVTVKRGQLWTTYAFLADRWGWGSGKTHRFIQSLEADGMVSLCKPDGDVSGTIITILNYERYQGDTTEEGGESERVRNDAGMMAERAQNARGTPTESSEERKEKKERKEEASALPPPRSDSSEAKPTRPSRKSYDFLKIWKDARGGGSLDSAKDVGSLATLARSVEEDVFRRMVAAYLSDRTDHRVVADGYPANLFILKKQRYFDIANGKAVEEVRRGNIITERPGAYRSDEHKTQLLALGARATRVSPESSPALGPS